jgi:hypothetical protein
LGHVIAAGVELHLVESHLVIKELDLLLEFDQARLRP